MDDKLKDNEFLASLDLDLIGELVDLHFISQAEESINIISLMDFHSEKPLEKAS